MDARSEILGRLKHGRRELPPVRQGRPIEGDLWARFWDRAEPLGVERIEWQDLANLPRPWHVAPELRSLGLEEGAESDVWNAQVGLTGAIHAVAETGSFLLRAGPGAERLASLAPPIHVILLRPSQIVATLDDSIQALGDRTCVWVTGPSRTADIAGILVRGIHGPKRLLLCLLPEEG